MPANLEYGGLKDFEALKLKLGLKPLPLEGGWFNVHYRSTPHCVFNGIERPVGGAIYFLITQDSFSGLHRIAQDELFHFYAGDPVLQIQFGEQAKLVETVLGNQDLTQQSPTSLVLGGHWQGTQLLPGGSWALLGTTTHPAYMDQDFEMGSRNQLLLRYPQFKDAIIQFTREEK